VRQGIACSLRVTEPWCNVCSSNVSQTPGKAFSQNLYHVADAIHLRMIAIQPKELYDPDSYTRHSELAFAACDGSKDRETISRPASLSLQSWTSQRAIQGDYARPPYGGLVKRSSGCIASEQDTILVSPLNYLRTRHLRPLSIHLSTISAQLNSIQSSPTHQKCAHPSNPFGSSKCPTPTSIAAAALSHSSSCTSTTSRPFFSLKYLCGRVSDGGRMSSILASGGGRNGWEVVVVVVGSCTAASDVADE
jgi:hypothetical protein